MKLRVFPQANVLGWPDGPDAPAKGHQAFTLAQAFTRRYSRDAHFAAYEAGDDEHGRKRLKTTAPARGLHPRMVLLVVDVDDPTTHAENAKRKRDGRPTLPASEEFRADARARIAALRADAPGVVAYETRGGYRLVGLLASPHVIACDADVVAWRVRYTRALARLARLYDIAGDPACIDWTRLYRLPHATRSGREEPEAWPTWGAWHELGAWPEGGDDELAADAAEATARGWPSARFLAPAPPPRAARVRSRAVHEPAVAADIAIVSSLARRLAELLALLPRGQGRRHNALLALVGALVDAGWTDAALRRVTGDLAALLGDAREELASAVETTRARSAAAQPYLARGYLLEHERALADVLAEAQETPAERWRRACDHTPVEHEFSPADAAHRITAMLGDARESRGLVLVDAPCGTGKTSAAVTDAASAAASGARSVYLARDHAVARATVARLEAQGVRVAYLGSVLAHVNDDGERTCLYALAAEQLAAAGVSVPDTLCDGSGYAYREHLASVRARARAERSRAEGGGARVRLPVIAGTDDPCGMRDTCPAYAARRAQQEKLEQADVLVTVHTLASVAHRWLAEAPDNALAVVDEGPELLETVRVTAEELAVAARALEGAVARSEAWRSPMLTALAEGLARAGDGPVTVSALLAAGLAVRECGDDASHRATVEGWARACVWRPSQAGEAQRRRTFAPRPSRSVVQAVRRGFPPRERLLALRLAAMVARALAAEAGEAPRVNVSSRIRDWGKGAGARELALVAVNDAVGGLLGDARFGRVILDATPNPEALGAALGERVTVERLGVRDGAPVERVFIPWSHSTRRHCLPEGELAWEELAGPLAEGLAVAAEGLADGAELAVFTWRPVARALDGDGATLPPRVADAVQALRRRGVRLVTGYYGALRGRDDWKGADALLAFGAPWPSAADVALACEAWGLVGGERDMGQRMMRAELEQACGRIRAPWRTRPARVVVVASAPPARADARWKVRELACGRPRVADREQLAAMADRVGITAAAVAAGCSTATVKRARREARAGVVVAVGGVGSQPVAGVTSATGSDPPPPPPPLAAVEAPPRHRFEAPRVPTRAATWDAPSAPPPHRFVAPRVPPERDPWEVDDVALAW